MSSIKLNFYFIFLLCLLDSAVRLRSVVHTAEFWSKYLCDIEIDEKMGLNHENKRERKSCDTLPLSFHGNMQLYEYVMEVWRCNLPAGG